MNIKLILITICLMFLSRTYIFSEELSSDGKREIALEYSRNIAIFELLSVGNSLLATASPKAFGVTGLVLFLPVSLGAYSEDTNITTIITASSLFASLCAYNLFILSDNHFSKKQIFVHNMIGWNVWALGTLGVAHLTRDKNKEEGFKTNLTITPSGFFLLAQYRF